MRLLSFSKHIHRETRCSSSYFSRKKRKKKKINDRGIRTHVPHNWTRVSFASAPYHIACVRATASFILAMFPRALAARPVAPCATAISAGTTTVAGTRAFATGVAPSARHPSTSPTRPYATRNTSATWGWVYTLPAPFSCYTSFLSHHPVNFRHLLPQQQQDRLVLDVRSQVFTGNDFHFSELTLRIFVLPDFTSWLMIKFEIFNNQTNWRIEAVGSIIDL